MQFTPCPHLSSHDIRIRAHSQDSWRLMRNNGLMFPGTYLGWWRAANPTEPGLAAQGPKVRLRHSPAPPPDFFILHSKGLRHLPPFFWLHPHLAPPSPTRGRGPGEPASPRFLQDSCALPSGPLQRRLTLGTWNVTAERALRNDAIPPVPLEGYSYVPLWGHLRPPHPGTSTILKDSGEEFLY